MRTMQIGLLALWLTLATAVANAGDSPEAVIRQFLAALQTDGAAAAVTRFTHPDEAARFKRMFMPRIRRSLDDPNDKFREKILGRNMPYKEIEAMAPADFMAAFLRDGRMDGSEIKPPRFLSSTREGDIVQLVVLTDLKALNGAPEQRRDVLKLKAWGDTWGMMLSPQLEAYATVLISE